MSTVPASFYVTGGTLRPDAPSYVDRKADTDLLEGLLAAEFCYVLTSRQMGKSSLMVRTANKLRERAVHVIVLDLSSLGQNMTREQWYNGLLATMGDQLRMEDELYEFWTTHEALSPVQRWFKALEKKVLPRRPGPVVVFIDEIDVVRSLPFSTDEFFAAIRECYNRRALDPEFGRLTFCLLGVATPGDLVRNTNITPFNIGRRIDLDDFTSEEAKSLARGLHTEGSCALKLLARVLHWTSGHPYLTQRLCHAWARDPETNKPGDVDRLCGELFLTSRARERDDNLIFVRDRLLRSDVDLTDLLELYLKAWNHRPTFVDEASPLVSILRLSGIVRAEGGRLSERNRIYHQVFDRSWVNANLPDAELRRQRAAYRRGVARAAAIASIVIAAMTIMILIAADKTRQARTALAKSYFSQAQLRRVSGNSGQRYESVAALEKASRYYTNRVELRDELVACLALPDLKEISRKYHLPQGPDIYELNPERGICAIAKMNGTILLQKLDDGAVIKSIPGFGSSPRRLRFGRDPEVLLAEYQSESSTQIVIWNWPEGTRLFTIPHGIHAEAIDFSMDGKKLAVSQSEGQLTVYALPGGEVLYGPRKLRLNSGFPRLLQTLRFDLSGNYLAECCLDDIDVQIWNITNPRRRSPVLLSHNDRVYDLSWHPGGEILATACGDSGVYLWNVNRPERGATRFSGHDRKVNAVAFNHSGTQLASTADDETLRLWTGATNRSATFHLGQKSLNRLRFSTNDTTLLAAGGEPYKHRVWEVAGAEYVSSRIETGSRDLLHSIDFSPNGRWLLASTGERTTIWDANKGAESGLAATTNAHAAAFSADSRSLIVCTDKDLSRYALSNVSVGDQPRLLPGFSCTLSQAAEPFRTMTLALNRTSAAVVSQQNVLMISLRTNCSTQLRSIPVATSYRRLALHPSGNWLAASLAGSGSVDIWNLAEDIAGRTPISRPTSSYFLFSPDEKWLVACWGGAFQFYRVGLWTKAFDIPRESPSDQHAPVAFFGSIVALASSGYKVQLFHLSGNESSPPKPFVTLEGPDHDSLEMLAFSPDGRRLAVGTANNTVQLWNLALVRDQLTRLALEKEWPGYQ